MINNILYNLLKLLNEEIQLLKENKMEYVYNVVMLIYLNVWIIIFISMYLQIQIKKILKIDLQKLNL